MSEDTQKTNQDEPKVTEANEEPKEEKSLKDLQAEAVELGMPQEEVEVFRQKGPLLVMLKALRKQHELQEELDNKPVATPDVEVKEDDGVKRVVSIIETPNIKEEKKIEKQYRTKAMRMREKLENQEKVPYFIPLEGKEKPGVVREVTINGRKELMHVSGAIITPQFNGYKMIIPKGVQVMIPRQVFFELNRSRERTFNAGAAFAIDRLDEKGKPVSERLM